MKQRSCDRAALGQTYVQFMIVWVMVEVMLVHLTIVWQGSTFGQTEVQFMMVWQRYSLFASSTFLSRSCVASSRESMIHLHISAQLSELGNATKHALGRMHASRRHPCITPRLVAVPADNNPAEVRKALALGLVVVRFFEHAAACVQKARPSTLKAETAMAGRMEFPVRQELKK
jgi:hypothetical protein